MGQVRDPCQMPPSGASGGFWRAQRLWGSDGWQAEPQVLAQNARVHGVHPALLQPFM